MSEPFATCVIATMPNGDLARYVRAMLTRERRPADADDWPDSAKDVYVAFEGIEFADLWLPSDPTISLDPAWRQRTKAQQKQDEAEETIVATWDWEQIGGVELWEDAVTLLTKSLRAFGKCGAKRVFGAVIHSHSDGSALEIYRYSNEKVKRVEVELSDEDRNSMAIAVFLQAGRRH